MDRLAAMQIFVKVADAGSFTVAATALDLPTSVSQQVTRLEAHLGVRLLQRSTRRVRLTDDGAACYARVRALLDDLGDLEQPGRREPRPARPTADRRHRGVRGLRADPRAARLPAALSRHPARDRQQRPPGRPDRGRRRLRDPRRRGPRRITGRTPLERIARYTLASADHFARHGMPMHPRGLVGQALVGYFSTVTGIVYPYTFDRGEEHVEIDGPFVAAFNDANAYLAAGPAELGVLQAPAGPWIDAAIAAGRLVRILADRDAGSHVHTILYPGRRQLPARVEAFVDRALERFAKTR